MKKFILAAVLAAVVMVPFVLQRATLNQLRAENQRQQARIDELSEELRRASTNLVRTNAAGASSSLSREQLHELMRLRAEVTALRQMTNAAAQQPAPVPLPELRQDAAAAALPEGILTTNTAPWNNAGFARPADTLSTLLWAMQQGRMDVVLNTATPEGQIQLQQVYGSSTNPVEKLQADGGKVVEVRPSTAFPSNENEVYMSIVMQDTPQQITNPQSPETAQAQPRVRRPGRAMRREQTVKLEKVGNDWRYSGVVGGNIGFSWE